MRSKIIYLKKLELFKELDNFREGQFFGIVDQKVKNHLPQWIQFSPNVFWLKDPEQEKNIDTFSRAVNFFIKQGIKKESRIYVFGGGSTSDFSGYVASTLLYGVEWVIIPTTLYAMVEGSIGGQVGLNLDNKLNALGTNYPPELVYICGDFLSTLSERDTISGKGEIIKYGFLSKTINQMILKKSSLEEIAFECAKFKNSSSEKVLSFGHILSSVFEESLNISSGQAMAMGLRYLFKLMHLEESLQNWEIMVKNLDIPIEKLAVRSFDDFNINKFLSALEAACKKNEARMSLMLVKDIAIHYIEEVSYKDLRIKIQADEELCNLVA